jgi:AcrR family transcriptional regulator
MLLLASRPIDDVTVTDIAAAADMTLAAIYYHFASKEDILREGIVRFTDLLTQESASRLAAATETQTPPGELLTELLTWLETQRAPAAVYFATSAGQSLTVEAIRRQTRIELIEQFSDYLRATRSDLSRTERGVASVGLLSVLETAGTSWAMQDQDWLSLGPRAFLVEVATLAERIVGPAATS